MSTDRAPTHRRSAAPSPSGRYGSELVMLALVLLLLASLAGATMIAPALITVTVVAAAIVGTALILVLASQAPSGTAREGHGR